MTEPMVLRFARGGPGRLVLRSDPALADVCRTEFDGIEPSYTVKGRTIEIMYHNTWSLWGGGAREAAITLSERTPWRIEVRGGIGKAEFDLSRIVLDGIHIEGGIGKLELALGEPRGAIDIVVRGGVGKVVVDRPAGVPVGVRLGGGAGKVVLDGQTFAGIGGGTNWQSPGYEAAADRFHVTVQGGCAKFVLEGA